MRRLVLMAVCLSLMLASTLFAAENSRRYSRASLFFSYDGWKEDFSGYDNSLNQSVSGFRLHQVVNERIELGVWSSLSSNSLTDINSDKTTLTSLNDTRLTGDYYFPNRVAVIGVSLNLPTGKKKLTEEQYAILLSLADNSRKYVERRLGQGFNIGAEAFVRPQVGEGRFIAGGGFLHRGAYQILEMDPAKYQYGSELYGRVGLVRDPQPVGYSLIVEMRTYGKDKYDGTEVFQAGNTIAASGVLTVQGEWRVVLAAQMLIRGKAKVPASGTGTFSEEAVKSGRNEMLFSGSIGKLLNAKLQLLGRGEFKSVSENDYALTDVGYRPKSHYVGFGGGLGYQFNLNISGSAMATYYVGKVDDNNDLTGLGLLFALTYRYW